MKLTKVEKKVLAAMNNRVPLTQTIGVGWKLGTETIGYKTAVALQAKGYIRCEKVTAPTTVFYMTEYGHEVLEENIK